MRSEGAMAVCSVVRRIGAAAGDAPAADTAAGVFVIVLCAVALISADASSGGEQRATVLRLVHRGRAADLAVPSQSSREKKWTLELDTPGD